MDNYNTYISYMNYIKNTLLFFLVFLIIYLYTLPRYISYLPTLPVYPNSIEESNEVEEYTKTRTLEDIDFFKKTDKSVTSAFLDIVPMFESELNSLITQPFIIILLYLLKYIINRPRPYQLNKNINVLASKTGNTPAFPAGHALQAYYLAKHLSTLFPDKREELYETAIKCDICRIKAGIHYKSDGEFSKKIVEYIF
uniref:Phosphatidic acid phosphatase type 2/haloperoxidase domain-containing protein n=1 Tax=viral metagenome TaxID=1070528 RepID=A0A6C0CMY3_9ZZZZ